MILGVEKNEVWVQYNDIWPFVFEVIRRLELEFLSLDDAFNLRTRRNHHALAEGPLQPYMRSILDS